MAQQPTADETETETDLRSVVAEDMVVRVTIPNNAPIGGDTQFEQFTVDEVAADEFSGIDETWADRVTVSRDGDDLYLQSGGKSGRVVAIERLKTNADGVPVLPPEETVLEA